MESACWLVENSLIENGADAEFNAYATGLTLGVLASTLVDKIRNLPAEKQSEKTVLMDYYIRLLPAGDQFQKLKGAAVSGQIEDEGKVVGQLNKLQRYTCLRKCASAV